MLKTTKRRVALTVVAWVACVIAFWGWLRGPLVGVIQMARGKHTVAQRVSQYGGAARARLRPAFEEVGAPYPPEGLMLVGLKQERRLEVWVTNPPRLIKSYPILGASGTLGPKLREGDRQVPEGLYRIESLNPNSLFHLALRVDYPNAFDREQGRVDGREDLGGDIMIHGGSGSVGCLAMGDEAAEDLFVLAAETGIDNIRVILSPVDFRVRSLPVDMAEGPAWRGELYAAIRGALLEFGADATSCSRASAWSVWRLRVWGY